MSETLLLKTELMAESKLLPASQARAKTKAEQLNIQEQTEPKKKTSNNNYQSFSNRLLEWFDSNGRHDLPWQQHKKTNPDAYKVWISEVMLQQTQVKTVIPYFTRFMQSFPTVQDLANASWEEVADHWAGLGYYARARNLHKGAKQLVEIIDSTGNFPQTVTHWEQISGVGQSTAGAIVSMGLHKYGVICDGNVKRVLTRWSAIDGDITKSATNKELWQLAERLTPDNGSGYFAQAMMDMGATICHRTKPACITKVSSCPIQNDCQAFAQNRQTSFPVKAKKTAKSSKYSHVLLLANGKKQLLWLQRPDSGIWGGLWCLPLRYIYKLQGKKVVESADNDKVYEKELTIAEQIIDGLFFVQLNDVDANSLLTNTATIKHTLTHFHWYLSRYEIAITDAQVLKINSSLTKANIIFKWLTLDEASGQLALPKAMMKVIVQES